MVDHSPTCEPRYFGGDAEHRPLFGALKRGFRQLCPNCGRGRIFDRFLKVNHACAACGQELHHHRADDAPPYFTIFIVGHIVIPLVLILEKAYAPSSWVHAAIWLPVTLALTFFFLPRVKGSLVGLQWSQRMHGFGGSED